MIIKEKLESFGDDRGFIAFASQKLLGFDYKYLTIGTMVPGSVRGGHYHNRIFEKLMCLTGIIRFRLDDEEIILLPGEIADIPIGKVHTLFNDGSELASFVEFKSEAFDKNDTDTFTPDN